MKDRPTDVYLVLSTESCQKKRYQKRKRRKWQLLVAVEGISLIDGRSLYGYSVKAQASPDTDIGIDIGTDIGNGNGNRKREKEKKKKETLSRYHLVVVSLSCR